MARMVCTMEVRLPWWWRLYAGLMVVSHYCRVIDADPMIAAEFLVRHTQVLVKDQAGRVVRRERLRDGS